MCGEGEGGREGEVDENVSLHINIGTQKPEQIEKRKKKKKRRSSRKEEEAI